MTLEEIVKLFQDLWDSIITDEYLFWIDFECSLDEIIIEASEAFEEVLAMDYIENVEFIENNDEKFDLNLLLNPVRTFVTKEYQENVKKRLKENKK